MELIERFLDKARELSVNVDSIVVELNGKREEKFVNNIELHELRSCSKILIAFAYVIAFDEKLKCKNGDVIGLDTEVYSTFSKLVKNPPSYVKDWTIRTLLTHSTGFEKMMLNEKHLEAINGFDALQIIFDTPTKFNSNTHFTYSNVEPYLLSVFFQENFGISIKDFIVKKIFKPLNITNYVWKNIGNYCAGATGLFLNYKDFHKIGKLLFNRGKFENKQVIPAMWVKEMSKPQFDCKDYYKPERVLPKLNAGYYVWISRDDIVFRDGSNGQYIICDYKNDLLVTIMSSQKDMSLVTECLRGLI